MGSTIAGIVIALVLAGIVYYLIKRKTNDTGPTISERPANKPFEPKG